MNSQIKENNEEIEKLKETRDSNLKNIEFMNNRITKLQLDITNS